MTERVYICLNDFLAHEDYYSAQNVPKSKRSEIKRRETHRLKSANSMMLYHSILASRMIWLKLLTWGERAA